MGTVISLHERAPRTPARPGPLCSEEKFFAACNLVQLGMADWEREHGHTLTDEHKMETLALAAGKVIRDIAEVGGFDDAAKGRLVERFLEGFYRRSD